MRTAKEFCVMFWHLTVKCFVQIFVICNLPRSPYTFKVTWARQEEIRWNGGIAPRSVKPRT